MEITQMKSGLRKREDIQHASLRRVLRQISHRVDETQRRGLIPRIESTRNDRSGPTTNACQYRDILLTVRTTITNRLPDDSRTTLELPQQRSALRIDRFEPTIHRAVKNHVARRGESPTPHRKILGYGPHLFVLHRVPRQKLAAISARSRIHAHIRTDIRRARDVIRFKTFFVHAEILVRDVDETRSW